MSTSNLSTLSGFGLLPWCPQQYTCTVCLYGNSLTEVWEEYVLNISCVRQGLKSAGSGFSTGKGIFNRQESLAECPKWHVGGRGNKQKWRGRVGFQNTHKTMNAYAIQEYMWRHPTPVPLTSSPVTSRPVAGYLQGSLDQDVRTLASYAPHPSLCALYSARYLKQASNAKHTVFCWTTSRE